MPLKIIYLKILVFLENIPHPFKQSVKLSANISTDKAMKGNRSISDWFLFNFATITKIKHLQGLVVKRPGWQLLTMWQYLDNYIKQLLKLLVSIGMHILPTILFPIFLWRCGVKQSWAFSLDNNFLYSSDLNCLMPTISKSKIILFSFIHAKQAVYSNKDTMNFFYVTLTWHFLELKKKSNICDPLCNNWQ